jgi:hypothetical protein
MSPPTPPKDLGVKKAAFEVLQCASVFPAKRGRQQAFDIGWAAFSGVGAKKEAHTLQREIKQTRAGFMTFLKVGTGGLSSKINVGRGPVRA